MCAELGLDVTDSQLSGLVLYLVPLSPAALRARFLTPGARSRGVSSRSYHSRRAKMIAENEPVLT